MQGTASPPERAPAAGSPSPLPPLAGASPGPGYVPLGAATQNAAPTATPPEPARSDDEALHRIAEVVQDCYETAERAGALAATRGRLSLKLTVSHSGSIANVTVDRAATADGLAGGPFERCVVESAARVRFPERSDSAERFIDVPLDLSPTS